MLCSDAVTAVREAEALCQSSLDWKARDLVYGDHVSASQAAARIANIADQLSLVGAVSLSQTCAQMKDGVDTLIKAAKRHGEAKNSTDDSSDWIRTERPAAESLYTTARAGLERLRDSFIERSLIELKSTSR